VVKLDENKKSYANLIREMESLKGFKIIHDMELLKITNQIFSMNFMQLCYVIDMYEKDPELAFLCNRQKLNEINLEILRLFHNYSASSFTLIRHSSVFKDNLKNENVSMFYDNELEKLKNIEVVDFMKDLRNYIQHYSFPVSSRQVSVKMIEGTDSYEMEQKILLRLQSLLAWDGWKSKGKAYLKQFNDDIEIKLFCKEYYEYITKFNKAFFEMLAKEYEKDIYELQEFQNNMNKLYPPPSKL